MACNGPVVGRVPPIQETLEEWTCLECGTEHVRSLVTEVVDEPVRYSGSRRIAVDSKSAYCGCGCFCWREYSEDFECDCDSEECVSRFGGPCGCIRPGEEWEMRKGSKGYWQWKVMVNTHE